LEQQGFAFEGAAMALTLLDHLPPGNTKYFQEFLHGPGEPHSYMVHVGAGWAFARLPWLRYRIAHRLDALDPLLRWLVMDGFGFHEGYFHWSRSVRKKVLPKGVNGYALRAFDQGLGRSLWFIECADIYRIAKAIETFSLQCRGDLWSGVGLACAYAGGTSADETTELIALAGEFKPHFAQGASFAAKARQRAGNESAHTEQVCRIACGLSARDAADLTDTALRNVLTSSPEPDYEQWRSGLRQGLERLQEVKP
jgi:hypothetical protein